MEAENFTDALLDAWEERSNAFYLAGSVTYERALELINTSWFDRVIIFPRNTRLYLLEGLYSGGIKYVYEVTNAPN